MSFDCEYVNHDRDGMLMFSNASFDYGDSGVTLVFVPQNVVYFSKFYVGKQPEPKLEPKPEPKPEQEAPAPTPAVDISKRVSLIYDGHKMHIINRREVQLEDVNAIFEPIYDNNIPAIVDFHGGTIIEDLDLDTVEALHGWCVDYDWSDNSRRGGERP